MGTPSQDALSKEQIKQTRAKILATIGRWLREAYAQEESEPLPERIMELVARLEQQETTRESASQ
jgi:hypothetical protein